MRSNNKTNDNCWLCRRSFASNEGRFPVGPPIKHHIVPKQKYRDRWEYAEIILLCKRCHNHIHKMFTNNELKTMTKEELRKHEKIIDYVKWIRKD